MSRKLIACCCSAIALFLTAPVVASATDNELMLMTEKLPPKPKGATPDIYWDKSDIKRSYKEICYFERGTGRGLVVTLEDAIQKANEMGADAMLIIYMEYQPRSQIFGKLLKYEP